MDSTRPYPRDSGCKPGSVPQEQDKLPPTFLVPDPSPQGPDSGNLSHLVPPQKLASRSSEWRRGQIIDMNGYQEGASVPGDESANLFSCQWAGCTSGVSFHRRSDLRRHVEAYHLQPHSHICDAGGCRRTFNRKDNLQDHVRRVHSISSGRSFAERHIKRTD
jgi:hypothetical protein